MASLHNLPFSPITINTKIGRITRFPPPRLQVSLGAEDCCVQDKGAFTGGVSTSMLKSCGVE
jgi:triosephosphate isomerase